MKITQLIILAIVLLPFNSLFGQTDTTNFLKDYKAPDFKFRSLNLGISSNGNGGINSNVKSNFTLTSNLDFRSYINSKKVQGFSRVRLNSTFRHAKQNESISFNFNFGLSNTFFRRRFINDKKFFFGYGNVLRTSQYNYVVKDSVNLNGDGLNLLINPTLSFGKGRLEPVYYARKSWDIEKALLKSKSISSKLTIGQKNILADKIAQIQNRRFFDSRLNRIYQLEAIDSVLQEMGIVDEFNMQYYAHLSDAFLFAHNSNRQSGGQFEMGVTQGFLAVERSAYQNYQNYNLNGFISYVYHLPISYQFQHDFKVFIIAGKERAFSNNPHSDSHITGVNFEYDFGYYPTTRTYVDIKTIVGFTLDDNYLGLNANFYHYFSPRMRLQGNASLMLGDYGAGINNQLNPFLNNIISDQFGGMAKSYEFRLGLNYAIF